MTHVHFYPIGADGQPWGRAQVDAWRARQSRHRRFDQDVVPRIDAISARFEKIEYGRIDYAGDIFPLLALRSRFDPDLPTALVTGGVHGYETSGVMGAIKFLERDAKVFDGKLNLVVVPCVSPWAYERICRWNYDAVDPNRHFRANGPAMEASALVEFVRSLQTGFLVHIDLHETTDSDEAEFRPALAARDGKPFSPEAVPDGFYLVDDSVKPERAFQQAIISAVQRVTHIAPPDAHGKIIGTPVVAHGVIEYPVADLGLCASISGARYTTTTEVYPDSPRSTPDICIEAQVVAVRAALDYALVHQ